MTGSSICCTNKLPFFDVYQRKVYLFDYFYFNWMVIGF